MSLLRCPACGNPCAEVPPCTTIDHCYLSGDHGYGGMMWCEDREGTCACGAELRVAIQWDRGEGEEDDEATAVLALREEG